MKSIGSNDFHKGLRVSVKSILKVVAHVNPILLLPPNKSPASVSAQSCAVIKKMYLSHDQEKLFAISRISSAELSDGRVSDVRAETGSLRRVLVMNALY
jgi:hypothetical protein